MNNNHYCGECAYLMEEDTDGCGYCAMKELFTGVYCGDPACEEFTLKTEDMTDNKTTPEQLVKEWLPEYEKRIDEYNSVILDQYPDASKEQIRRLEILGPDEVFIDKHFAEALEAFRENERMNHEWMIQELKDRLEIIKRVTPYSFKSLTDEDKAVGYYLASCDCGWWGSSALLEGGGAIADTGDYFDCTCPFCGSADIGEMNDPYRKVWDQACREQREMCAQAYIDYNGEDFDHETVSEAICLAPAPEFKLTEKE